MLHPLKAWLQSLPAYQISERTTRHALGLYKDAELAILPFVVDPARVAVDVGAHAGVFTHALLKLNVPVVAIEANPRMAKHLSRLYGRKARVVWGAASSSAGSAILRLPKSLPSGSNGIATVEDQNTLGGAEVETLEVPRITLDAMNLDPVGFMKVDVEGHELDVLTGARGMLARDHPALIIEAEERHRAGAVASLLEFLAPLDYRGFMFDSGRLVPLAGFDPAREQSVCEVVISQLNAGIYRGRYVNNFLFL